jgi:beta-1,4-N-acetylglucosaminyltransferase
MIFVTVGSSDLRFDRLLESLTRLAGDELLVVQHGLSSVRPTRAAVCVPFLTFDEITRYIREARAVVTHGGVGSIMTSLNFGKRPIVVPRQKRFNEAVDDHQVTLARRLDAAGLVVLIEEPSALGDALGNGQVKPLIAAQAAAPLAADVREFLAECIERRTGARARG